MPRSLPLKKVNDIDQIPLTEFGGNLQTYEMELGKMGKGGKSRNIALKTLKMKIKMRMRMKT